MAPQPNKDMQPLDWQQRSLVEFAIKAAETFVSAYYAATDAPRRVELLPTLYVAESSTIVWNGNAFQGNAALAQFLAQMPASKHEIQAFDCHPIGGGIVGTEFTLPSLMLTVSGVVTHHTPGSITTLGDTGAPKSALGNKKRRANELSHLPLDSLPRAFSQNFVLVPQPNTPGGVNVNVSLTPATIPETQPTVPGENGLPAPPPTLVLAAQVFVQADSFRFVG